MISVMPSTPATSAPGKATSVKKIEYAIVDPMGAEITALKIVASTAEASRTNTPNIGHCSALAYYARMWRLRTLFRTGKPIIAMVHLPALPGRPRHDKRAGMGKIVDSVAAGLTALQAAGVDGLLFCNEADLPYQLATGPEIAAGMAAVIGQVRAGIAIPFGINIVWGPHSQPCCRGRYRRRLHPRGRRGQLRERPRAHAP